MKKTNDNKKGFTIIEVVLVLAIAGMIFLVVFLAVPQLQQSRRDTQRRSDVSRIMSQLETRASNNNGQYPDSDAELQDFVATYLQSANYESPSGNVYTLVYGADPGTAASADDENIAYLEGARCNGEVFDTGQSSRSVAMRLELEGGGFFCIDNQ